MAEKAYERKSVGIVGAGISGIVAAKELSEQGVHCEVFEMMPVIGGAFAHYGWKEGKLTSSTAFTWFSDFPIEERQRHLGWPEWLDYLQRYIDRFDIQDKFHFNCKVTSIERNPSGGWDLRVHRKNWSNGAWQHPTGLRVEDATFEEHFDVLCIGSGLHNEPFMPDFPGAASFTEAGGELLHASKFEDATAFAGRRVVVVGAGESASDIAWLTSKHAEAVAISMRSPPGTLFPHTIKGSTADVRDNRLIYSLPRACWPFLLRGQKRFYEYIARDPAEKHRAEQFRFAAASNSAHEQCIFTINACKSFGIPKAIGINGATQHSAIQRIHGREVHFEDGSRLERCDAIIAGTGYRVKVPGIRDPKVAQCFADPRSLWKNMVSPDVGDFFLLGFCRPHQINLITCCEMQARAMAQIVSGRKALPSRDEMEQEIAAWKAHMGATFSRGYRALVDFIPFIDGLADFIGCAPSLSYYLFADPAMWLHMIYGPLQPSQYRLEGPGAAPGKARAVIMKTPYYSDRLDRIKRDVVVSILALLAAVMGLFGSKKWALVGRMRQPFQIVAGAVLAATAYGVCVAS